MICPALAVLLVYSGLHGFKLCLVAVLQNTHFLYCAPLGEIDWQTLTIPAVGLTVTLLILGTALYWVNTRKAKTSTLLSMPVPDPFTEGSPSDRRHSPRRIGRSIKVTIQLADDARTVFEGFILDRSIGGLRLKLDRDLKPDQILNIRTVDAPQTVAWIQAEVRQTHQLPDKTYEVGCQFVRTPPWAVMLTLG